MKRRASIVLRTSIIIITCIACIILLPKSENFRYEYQLGTPWRYETLKAPFDFPVYKAATEFESEKERIIKEQVPIFNLNESVKITQLNKFRSASSRLHMKQAIDAVGRKLEAIYDAGIIQLPDDYQEEDIISIQIVKDNIGYHTNLENAYTLKTAYTELVQTINDLHVSQYTKDQLLNLNLNMFLSVNLEFDASKTNLEKENRLQDISLTLGMIHTGETIISKDEVITQEKVKLLNSLQTEYRHNTGSIGNRIRIISGLFLLTIASVFIFSAYFYFFRKRTFYRNRDFIFLFSSFILTIALASISYYHNISIYAIPTLFLVIITNILIDKRSAFYLLLGTSMLISYFVPNSYMYLFMQITTGTVAMFSLSQLQRRGQLFLAIVLIFLTYSVTYTAFTLVQEGSLTFSYLFSILYFLINCLLLSFAYIFIYIFERIFGFISELTLIELSNPNHPALRDLTKKAPGTFQHSLIVANLAEEAVYRVGGNPLLVRTGALYHDIGKTMDPIYFIENQAGGINPHSTCDFDESAQHIIEHVTQGVTLGKKYKLPEAIIDFIRTHHGKSKVWYFYNSFKNKHPDQLVNEAIFTYAGPDPSSKEEAILMMADAVEAASRSLPDKTEENIAKLVNDIIDGQTKDGRFVNTDITFRNISIIKKVYTETLINIYHSRIAYPKLNKEN